MPANHVYVHHISAPSGDGVHRLPDAAPREEPAAPGQWWPPGMLDPAWIEQHADEFDVFHIHFGFDALDPTTLGAVLAALAERNKPVVYTVHDLRNPHHVDRRAHDRHLDVLIPRADALITLTRGAAAEIERRWGRRATVVPHPHVVDLDRMAQDVGTPREDFVVGVHAKSVRPSMDPGAVVTALLPLVRELPHLRLVVDVHHDVADPQGGRHDPSLMRTLRSAADGGALALHVHDCYTDDELWAYLQSIDLSVLPYRFGTHSGWLEACYDLGTAVLAPSCGYFAEQRECLSYKHDEGGLDIESLQAAVRDAYVRRPRWRAVPAHRRIEREEIARSHRATYESVLS